MSLVTCIYVGQFMRPSLVIKASYGGMTPYRQQCINTCEEYSRVPPWLSIYSLLRAIQTGLAVWLNTHIRLRSSRYAFNHAFGSALPNNQRTFGTGVSN